MKSLVQRILLISLSVVCAPLNFSFAAPELDPRLPEYKPTVVTGAKLTSVGSDAMADLIDVWLGAYRKLQPGLQVQAESRGSAFAPPALIEGTANVGYMSRPMKREEMKGFRARYGFEPTDIHVAIAGVGIYVSEKNPLSRITYDQLDAVYSAASHRTNPTQEGTKEVTTWADLGASGVFSNELISSLGVVDSNIAHTFFRQQVLLQADLAERVEKVADAQALMKVIALNPRAIGFAPLEKPIPGVKLLAVSKDSSEQAIEPTETHVRDGSYPLSRELSLYVVRYPGRSLEPATQDFLKFVLSKQGQTYVREKGFIPLTAQQVATELTKLE